MNKSKRKLSGFTLIELLVVIAIIGVLASIVLASLNTARLKSRDARRVADMKQIQLALELYFDTNKNYPTAALGATGGATALALVSAGGFMSTIPLDPLGNTGALCRGTSYCYSTNSATAPTSYHLGANIEGVLPTGKKGCNDATAGACYTGAAAGGTAFDGTGATIYDVVP